MKAGHIVSDHDLDFKRPGTGIQPEEMKYLIGRKVKSGIPEGDLIKWEHFE